MPKSWPTQRMSLNGYQTITAVLQSKATAKARREDLIEKKKKEKALDKAKPRSAWRNAWRLWTNVTRLPPSPTYGGKARSSVQGGPAQLPGTQGEPGQSSPPPPRKQETGGGRADPGGRGARAAAPTSSPAKARATERGGGGWGGVRPSAVSRHLHKMAATFGRDSSPSRRQTTASALTRAPFWTIRPALQARPPPSLRPLRGCGGPRGGTSSRTPRT